LPIIILADDSDVRYPVGFAMRIAFVIVLAVVLVPQVVRAQYLPPSGVNGYYGLSGGPGVILGPVWGYGPYYSHVYGSTYSNGMTLYNQPVPQPGATPGSFGSADGRRLFNVPPVIGLGWFGYRSPAPIAYGPARDFPTYPLGYTPRFATPDVKARYAAAAANPVAESYRQLATIGLLVFVPASDCALVIEGVTMPGTGTARKFESPKLEVGKEYRYTVTATIDGKPVTKEVDVKPGEWQTVDFRK
jgi:uncharacterized protein (TIGR03000 family)